jgi:hypothetical protein
LAELHEARVNSATHVETSVQRMRIEAGLWCIKLSLLNALSQNQIKVTELRSSYGEHEARRLLTSGPSAPDDHPVSVLSRRRGGPTPKKPIERARWVPLTAEFLEISE